jgi:hypothetical protein
MAIIFIILENEINDTTKNDMDHQQVSLVSGVLEDENKLNQDLMYTYFISNNLVQR